MKGLEYVKFCKSSKSKSKVHVMKGNGSAVCDNNIVDLSEIKSLVGTDICTNCLRECCSRLGGQIAANIELKFYFSQYSGGSAFLDSIHNWMRSGMLLSPKQCESSLKIFRDGKFRLCKDDDLLNKLYK